MWDNRQVWRIKLTRVTLVSQVKQVADYRKKCAQRRTKELIWRRDSSRCRESQCSRRRNDGESGTHRCSQYLLEPYPPVRAPALTCGRAAVGRCAWTPHNRMEARETDTIDGYQFLCPKLSRVGTHTKTQIVMPNFWWITTSLPKFKGFWLISIAPTANCSQSPFFRTTWLGDCF